jgi:hypothetical protein
MTMGSDTASVGGRRRGRVEVLDGPTRRPPGTRTCMLGRDLVIRPKVLSNFCVEVLSPRVEDLTVLAGAVAFADKAVTRRPSQGWGRDLEVVVPVHEPDFWRQPNVGEALVGALDLVTGDCWSFEFSGRAARRKGEGVQAPLRFGSGPAPIVLPYSGGLDSLAARGLLSAREPGTDLLAVKVGRRGGGGESPRGGHGAGRWQLVSVPFRLSDLHVGRCFREPSYRARSFVFGTVAGIAAHLAGAQRIVVPESGQGALGPSLIPVGNEAPYVGTHPRFTRKLATFLRVVLGTTLRFEHPRLWSTKGETLHKSSALGGAEGWARTVSCARNERNLRLGRGAVHCGVCAACLLRRQSLLAAGLDERRDSYLWPDLAAPTLAEAAVPGARATTQDDEEHAACGALSMTHLADLAGEGAGSRTVAEAAAELADLQGLEVPEAEMRLRRLIRAHHDEWQTFIARLGPGSFLAGWTEGVRC